MPASLLRRLATTGAAALALAAAVPAAAHADSILYLRGGDIWLSAPDGARTFQVTATGGWTYASQSDDGQVIVASRDRRLFVLNRNGDVVRELSTVIGSIWWQGPFDPQVSPDGRHVAYQYYTTTTGSLATGVAYAATDGSNPDLRAAHRLGLPDLDRRRDADAQRPAERAVARRDRAQAGRAQQRRRPVVPP